MSVAPVEVEAAPEIQPQQEMVEALPIDDREPVNGDIDDDDIPF